jgi:hypothetical protein
MLALQSGHREFFSYGKTNFNFLGYRARTFYAFFRLLSGKLLRKAAHVAC